VVVAAAYTWPLELTAKPLLVSDERKSVEEKVEEALAMRPMVKPMVVEVLLPQACGVNGKAAPLPPPPSIPHASNPFPSVSIVSQLVSDGIRNLAVELATCTVPPVTANGDSWLIVPGALPKVPPPKTESMRPERKIPISCKVGIIV